MSNDANAKLVEMAVLLEKLRLDQGGYGETFDQQVNVSLTKRQLARLDHAVDRLGMGKRAAALRFLMDSSLDRLFETVWKDWAVIPHETPAGTEWHVEHRDAI